MASWDDKVNKEMIFLECPTCKTLIELNDEHKKPLDLMLKIYRCYYCRIIYYIKGLEDVYRVKNKIQYKTWKLTDWEKIELDEYNYRVQNGEIIEDWIFEAGGGFSRHKWWTRF